MRNEKFNNIATSLTATKIEWKRWDTSDNSHLQIFEICGGMLMMQRRQGWFSYTKYEQNLMWWKIFLTWTRMTKWNCSRENRRCRPKNKNFSYNKSSLSGGGWLAGKIGEIRWKWKSGTCFTCTIPHRINWRACKRVRVSKLMEQSIRSRRRQQFSSPLYLWMKMLTWESRIENEEKCWESRRELSSLQGETRNLHNRKNSFPHRLLLTHWTVGCAALSKVFPFSSPLRISAARKSWGSIEYHHHHSHPHWYPCCGSTKNSPGLFCCDSKAHAFISPYLNEREKKWKTFSDDVKSEQSTHSYCRVGSERNFSNISLIRCVVEGKKSCAKPGRGKIRRDWVCEECRRVEWKKSSKFHLRISRF